MWKSPAATTRSLPCLAFGFASPNAAEDHLRALARISRVFKDLDFRQRLLKAPTAAEIFRVLSDEDAKY